MLTLVALTTGFTPIGGRGDLTIAGNVNIEKEKVSLKRPRILELVAVVVEGPGLRDDTLVGSAEPVYLAT